MRRGFKAARVQYEPTADTKVQILGDLLVFMEKLQ